MPINFTVKWSDLINDDVDETGDVEATTTIGAVRLIPLFYKGARALGLEHTPSPATFAFRTFTGYRDPDGLLKNKPGGGPLRVWANDPVFGLEKLPYRVEADLTDQLGNPVPFESFIFEAPATDTELDLTSVARVPIAMGSGLTRGLRGDVVTWEVYDEGPPRLWRQQNTRTGEWLGDPIDVVPDVSAEVDTEVSAQVPPAVTAEVAVQVPPAVTTDIQSRNLTAVDLGNSTVQFQLGGVNMGAPYTLPGAAWSTLAGKPAVIAAGADQDAARAVIGAGKPYALTQTESNSGIISTQINDLWPPGHIYRYVTNTTPGTTDVTTGWQLFLSLGGVIDLDARVNSVFRITAQLVIKSGTTLRMGPDCVMLRDWSASAGNKYGNAFFKNEHAPMISELAVDPGPWTPSTTDDNIYIDGGRIRPVDSSKLGCGYYLVGTKNLVLRDTVVERTYQDWGFVVGGDNFSARGVRVEQNAAVFEDGFHILYGSGVVDADYISSGDDCFAVGSNWNLPVNGVDIRMGRFRSEKAFAIKVVQNREGSTAGFANPTSLIQNVRFRDGSGKAGVSRNGLIMMTATGPGLLTDITVEGVALDADTQTHDGVNPYGVYCRYVTRLKLRDVKTKNHRDHAFWIWECPEVELTGLHAPYSSQARASRYSLELQDCLNAKVVGGDFTHTTENVIRTVGSTTAVFNGPVIQGVSNGKCGINVRDTSVASIHGATFRKSAGATSAIGILSGHATATIIADSCVFDVDQPYAQTAPAAYARLRNISRTVTVSTGAVTVRGDDNLKVLCEGGVSDTLVSFSGGYKGQTVTIVNGEADPTTVVLTVAAGTGSNQFDIGTNFVLDTQYKMITVIFNGLNWIPIYKG